MSEDKGRENIVVFPGATDIFPRKERLGGKTPVLQFPSPDSITNNGEPLSRDKEIALQLGEELVRHPIGIPGGFLDTVTDQYHDSQNDFKSFGRLIIEGGAYGLIRQTVPGLAEETPENRSRRDDRLSQDYAYLRDAVHDRGISGARPMIPLKPSEINSASKSNIGQMLDDIELIPVEQRSKFLEAKAQRLAQEIIGIKEGENHLMLDDRITVDREYLKKALSDRKNNPPFTPTKHSHLMVVK